MLKPYRVHLTDDDRCTLQALVSTGAAPARTLTHARILLKVDEGPSGPAWTDTRVAEAREISVPSVERVRKRFVLEGLEAALRHRPPARQRPRVLDGRQEAHLVALVCGEPPAGRDRWTLRRRADRLVELEIAASVSYQTVRRTLNTMSSSRGGSNAGASPAEGAATLSLRWKLRSVSPSGPRIPAVC
jgi:hypothetical protein